MRKHYALLASALLCVAAAQAQDAPTVNLVDSVTFNVQGQVAFIEDEQVVPNCFTTPSVDATVDITLHGYKADIAATEGWKPYIMWTMGSGFAIDQNFENPVKLGEDSYSFTLNKAKWGNPYEGKYYATVMLLFVKLEDDEIVDMLYGEDEEPVFYDVSYVTPNVFPAELQYTSPNNEWTDETFAEAYENGIVTFAFTNPITFSDEENAATVTYTVYGEDDPVTIPLSSITMEWNRLDGFFNVSFPYSSEDYSVEDISKITITLNDVISIPEEGTSTSITVNPLVLIKPAVNPAPRKQKNRMAENLLSGNEIVNVYNIQGMLVKESINKSTISELPAGLYIVDGKKIVVR